MSLTGLMQQRRGGDMATLLDQIVRWVRRARELDFDYVYTGQNYLTAPYQTLQPVPLLARLAQEAGDMRLVMTLVLPLHHPVSLAETLASLDWICGGRLTLTVVRGCRREELGAFAVPDRQVSARMTECLRCLLALWTGDPVTFNGAHFRLHRAQIGLLPRQRPHPPVWYAASVDRGVRRAARLGLPWHIGADADYATIARQVELYRSEALTPEERLPLAREVCCARTGEEARALAARFLGAEYAASGSPGAGFDDLARGRFVIGTPEACVEELQRYLALGIGALHARLAWPEMPEDAALRSLELFATRVLPQLRSGVSD